MTPLQPNQYPILEFDPTPEAIIEPGRIHTREEGFPEHAVACFFQDAIRTAVESGAAVQIGQMGSELGPNPIYRIEVDGRPVALFHPGVGAPLAAAFMDEMIARGARKFVACGGAGVLDKQIAVGHLLVPVSAVRDEGTSYHYAAPSREIEPTPAGLAAVLRTLERREVDYLAVKAWTTDAFYRETPEKTALRFQEGCLVVEMEAAAFFAVARFRGVEFGQILYGGDAVIHTGWDERGWISRSDIREHLLWLAAEAVLDIEG